MIRVVSAADVVYTKSDRYVTKSPTMAGEGQVLGHAKYFGDSSTLDRGPQGFLVDYGPHFRIDPHFHLVDQVQLFCRGSATIGKYEAVPVTVHYADAYRSYGPIIGGADGFAFFNFRSRADTGAHVMPGARDEMVRKGGRAATETTRLRLGDAKKGARYEVLIEPQEDGLAVTEIVAAPGVAVSDEIVRAACRYELVLDGTLEVDGRGLEKNSCVLAMGGDLLTGRRAGPEGLHLLQVQLPHG